MHRTEALSLMDEIQLANSLHVSVPLVRKSRVQHKGPRYTVLNGNDMELHIALEQPNRVATRVQKKTRHRRPLPPQDGRDWLTPNEAALALGCSVATVHRLRRGLIAGIEPLPYSQYGRKIIFRKASIRQWQESTEKRGLP
jgi:hypothetical protein